MPSRQVPCPTCGRLRYIANPSLKDSHCRTCRWDDHYANLQPGPEDALPPGNWRLDPFRRIQTYVEASA